ncbi:hypothetical protein U2086_14710, partial [Listeria monocytogenes]|uniref:hypothetical protein n=1 Tax=Listeria monocytogenes TaxID=1639 RepID=UPI002FDBEDFC
STLAGLIKKLTPFKKVWKKYDWVNKQHDITELKLACSKSVSKKADNTNPEKINNEQKALLVQLFADGNAKLNYEQVWHIYTRKAQEMIAL